MSNWHATTELPDGQRLAKQGRPWYFIGDGGTKIPIAGSHKFEYLDYVGIIKPREEYVIGITGCATNRWAVVRIEAEQAVVKSEIDTHGNLVSAGPGVALREMDEMSLKERLFGSDITIYSPRREKIDGEREGTIEEYRDISIF